MDMDRIREYIASVKWQVAKTMPKIPHSYTIKQWRPDLKATFEEFALHIRQEGVGEKFYSKTYTYLYVDGYKYWTMGAPIDETIVLNRAVAK
jgi:hypothetical protein